MRHPIESTRAPHTAPCNELALRNTIASNFELRASNIELCNVERPESSAKVPPSTNSPCRRMQRMTGRGSTCIIFFLFVCPCPLVFLLRNATRGTDSRHERHRLVGINLGRICQFGNLQRTKEQNKLRHAVTLGVTLVTGPNRRLGPCASTGHAPPPPP